MKAAGDKDESLGRSSDGLVSTMTGRSKEVHIVRLCKCTARICDGVTTNKTWRKEEATFP